MKIKKIGDFKIIKKSYFLILIIFFIFFIFSFFAKAQVSFRVRPEKFDLELEAGQIFKDKIIFDNLSEQVLRVSVETTHFSAAGEKGEMIFGQEASHDDVKADQWINFEKESFVIEPKKQQEINFSINPPLGVKKGGYYLISFFQTETVSDQIEAPVKVISRIGVLFLLNIINQSEESLSLDNQFEIIELNWPKFVQSGPILVNFRLKNNDLAHLRPGGKLIIRNLFGQIKEEITIKEQTILPNKIRYFEVETKNDKFFDRFFLGPYQAELILSTKTWQEKIGQQKQVVKKFTFWGFPWKVFLIFLIIPLAVIVFIVLNKKRKNK